MVNLIQSQGDLIWFWVWGKVNLEGGGDTGYVCHRECMQIVGNLQVV